MVTHIAKSARIFYETIEHFEISAEVFLFDLRDDVHHEEHPHNQRGKYLKEF